MRRKRELEASPKAEFPVTLAASKKAKSETSLVRLSPSEIIFSVCKGGLFQEPQLAEGWCL